MKKPIIISAITSLAVTTAILLMAENASQAKVAGDIAAPEIMQTIEISKSGRIVLDDADAEVLGEAADEWALDCYDQFGPEGWEANSNRLQSCLGGATTAG